MMQDMKRRDRLGMSYGQFRRNMMRKNQNRLELWKKLYTILGLMPLMRRSVKKSAYVYLPYGYSKEKEYNILYLMHGTGDDEKYWLKTNPYNKTMLDNMIADGDIEPLIVVTPTFYVEDDCADDLDQLTYSFAKELRNDLMPEIESVLFYICKIGR